MNRILSMMLLAALMVPIAWAQNVSIEDVRQDERREVIGRSVGTAAGLGCGAWAAGAGAATGPLGLFTAPIAALVCYAIVNSTTQTALNCTTPKGGRGLRGGDGSCVVIEVGFGIGF